MNYLCSALHAAEESKAVRMKCEKVNIRIRANSRGNDRCYMLDEGRGIETEIMNAD